MAIPKPQWKDACTRVLDQFDLEVDVMTLTVWVKRHDPEKVWRAECECPRLSVQLKSHTEYAAKLEAVSLLRAKLTEALAALG